MNKSVCHDCGKNIEIVDKEIANGFLLSYDNSGQTISVYKCKDCFTTSQSLGNFQDCEVYSRVVGYIRPVSQWHIGKKQEYSERKEFQYK